MTRANLLSSLNDLIGLKKMRVLRSPCEVRIVFASQKCTRFSPKQIKFYIKYAGMVLKALRNTLFCSFLTWMMKREEIAEEAIAEVQVNFFPFQKINGKSLAGKCNSDGEIHIYPKRLDYCRELLLKLDKEEFCLYVKVRAMATLIHELLHFKYMNDEEKVRTLTERYCNTFIKHREPQATNQHTLELLFRQ